MIDDVLVNKMETIKRCLKRIETVYDDDFENLKNYTKQDSIILNIQRLCEAAIDIAMHIIGEWNLGVPQSSREGFEILNREGIIDDSLTEKLKAMVGFRNIAVHDYQKLNMKIVKSIIEKNLSDIEEFAMIIREKVKEKEEKEQEANSNFEDEALE